MQQTWPQAYGFVRKSEGGNDDDKADHGGRTSRGITQREYDAWRVKQGLPLQDVWLASEQEIETIYHDNYWEPNCDALPAGPDYLLFDFNVNAGPHRATVTLQRALGIADDGIFGPKTLAAVQSANASDLIEKFSAEKISFYEALNQPRFIHGWLNRVAEVKANALTMIGVD